MLASGDTVPLSTVSAVDYYKQPVWLTVALGASKERSGQDKRSLLVIWPLQLSFKCWPMLWHTKTNIHKHSVHTTANSSIQLNN